MRTWTGLFLLGALALGCGDDTSATDGGVDSGADASLDGGVDGSVDAGADGGPVDGAVDGGADSGLDASADGGSDAGGDAGPVTPRLLAATYLGDPGSTNPTANQSARNALWSSTGELIVSGLGGEGAPVTAGAYQTTYQGHGGYPLGGDCWIGRLSEDLATLNAATLYGGPGEERPCYGLGELPSGDVVIGGSTTSSSGIATSGSFQSTKSGEASAFVAVLSGDLTTRRAGTYLGGDGTLRGGVQILASGDILAYGQVNNGAVTTTGAIQAATNGGDQEAWIGALSPNLSTLRWGTFLGSPLSGQATEVIIAAVERPDGDIVFQSSSPAASWLSGMRTSGATVSGGDGNRPFVARLTPGTSVQTLQWLSVLGSADGAGQTGQSFQEPGIALDGAGNVVVVGEAGTDMGTTGTLGTTLSGGGDCYVCKVAESGSIQWCTLIGGPGSDRCIAPHVASSGAILIAGTTDDASFCSGASATLNGTHGGGDDAFLAVVSSDGASMDWCTLIGGSGDEVGRWSALRADGRLALTGLTGSADFPTTTGVYDPSYNGNDDMFVAVYEGIPGF